MSASLILANGRIYTQDDHKPFVTAVAIRDGRIIAFGGDDEISPTLASRGQQVDLEGRSVTPGLVDAHIHFQGLALSLGRVDLSQAKSLDETLGIIKTAAESGERGEWVLGRGWDQKYFPEGRFPTAAELDQVIKYRPALLYHHSGHAAWANNRAMELAGIDASTADPPGGHIQRGSCNQPTGIFFEEAVKLVKSCIPRLPLDRIEKAMLRAQNLCLRAGLTGFHDFDGRSCFTALQALHIRDELSLRVVKNIPAAHLDQAIGLGLRTGFGDRWLRLGGIKIFADGALGPRTAAMIQPYDDDPENLDLIVTSKEEMAEKGLNASSHGISVAIHAIGDRAIRDVLDVIAYLRTEEGKVQSLPGDEVGRGLRHRIEHAQIVDPMDFQRFAELNVIASIQPVHAATDREAAEQRWGERTRFSYAWRTMLDNGVKLVFGTDAPVEHLDPIRGIYAAVTRRSPQVGAREDRWHPEQRLTLAEALRAYTFGPAYASGQELYFGSISPGKFADMTIYDRDIFSIPSDELLDVAVAGTIVGGEFKFRNW